MELKNKSVIITGASSGIGLEIARVLAVEKAKLALAARSLDNLDRVATDLSATGAPIIIVPTDVTRASDCRALVHAAQDAFGAVDILINNAGYAPPASLLDTTEQIWDDTLDTCLKGVYLMTQAAVAVMLEQGGGTIVNISSVAGKYGFENRSAYCAAKWGLHGFTEALRVELGSHNMRFHLVCPGAVATPWWEHVHNTQPDEIMRRMIRSEEVAEVVRWVLTQPERLQIDEVVIKTSQSPWEGI
jgi:3-oxoacyl-[acyl-carrier protein] reductase